MAWIRKIITLSQHDEVTLHHAESICPALLQTGILTAPCSIHVAETLLNTDHVILMRTCVKTGRGTRP